MKENKLPPFPEPLPFMWVTCEYKDLPEFEPIDIKLPKNTSNKNINKRDFKRYKNKEEKQNEPN